MYNPWQCNYHTQLRWYCLTPMHRFRCKSSMKLGVKRFSQCQSYSGIAAVLKFVHTNGYDRRELLNSPQPARALVPQFGELCPNTGLLSMRAKLHCWSHGELVSVMVNTVGSDWNIMTRTNNNENSIPVGWAVYGNSEEQPTRAPYRFARVPTPLTYKTACVEGALLSVDLASITIIATYFWAR